MSDSRRPVGDVLGIAPYGEAVNTLAKGAVEGASAFLKRICLPAAEEFGYLARDRVHAWRINNTARMLQKAEDKLGAGPASGKHAHPRLVCKAIHQSSWVDDDQVQDMWAGLLTSSCVEDGRDESNLIFMDLLSQLTSLEACVLDHSCNAATKKISLSGLVVAEGPQCSADQLLNRCSISDINRLDRELDHLRSLDLIHTGIPVDSVERLVDLTPTPLALYMYVRCQGSSLSPIDYFGLALPDDPPVKDMRQINPESAPEVTSSGEGNAV